MAQSGTYTPFARVLGQTANDDSCTLSLTTGHTLAFPSSQQSELNAFVQKFLIGGGTGSTNLMRNDPGVPFNRAMWVNWTVPALSSSAAE